MSTLQTGRQYLKQSALLALLVASILVAAPQNAGARERGGAARAGANADIFAAMCRAAGGTPTFTTSIDPAGYVTYIVECDGGYLDGLNCFFDEQFTDCTMTRINRVPEVRITETDGIKPLDEPANSGPVVDTGAVSEQIESVVVDQPTGGEETATSTPDSDDGGSDGGDGGAGGDGVIVVDPVLTDPVVSDGGGDAAPEPTAEPTKGDDGVGGVKIDPGLIKDPSILESIILDEPLAPPVEKVQDVEIK